MFSHGAYYTEVRRFVLRNLRDLGFGKTSMEGSINHEIGNLFKTYDKLLGKPFEPNMTNLNVNVVNALWAISCGETYENDDPKAKMIAQMVNQIFE